MYRLYRLRPGLSGRGDIRRAEKCMLSIRNYVHAAECVWSTCKFDAIEVV